MTDTIIDDDIIETNKSTTSARRPMFIETEVRTDTITRKRVGSTSGRSVHDILESTKSPTDGLPPTTYTYAHSVSYMPVTQNGAYEVPVMARRDLHGEYRPYSSSSFSSNSLFSSPTRFISNVRSQIANGYSTIRDRLTHNEHQQSSGQLFNSPSSYGGSRTTRTSSQSSTNGQGRNYNLRQRATPVHSTPRDADSETRKKSSKHRKSQDADDDEQQGDSEDVDKDTEQKDNILVRLIKRILRLPFDIISFIFKKFFGLPWWLLLPLLLFLGFYAFPNLACKPFEHYPESKIYQNCRKFQEYANNVTNQSVNYVQSQTYNRGIRTFKQIYQRINNVKHWIYDRFDDVSSGIRKTIHKKVDNVKERVNDVVETTKDNAKEYCDTGLQKVNALVEEFKREKAKYLGDGHALKPYQERELEALVRKLVEEYAADETGEADYALEANGGKIVDTRCTEYTDEPRQNVIKFLGIPIGHMSKQPNIMIKAGRMPGQCFPFKGDQGSVVIRLAVPVRPTEFVIEHLTKSVSIVGHINSAPNNFTVYALKDKHDKEGMVLGRYFYDAENGPSLQRFKPQLVNVPVVEYIEVRVTSNWGNPSYTCLYRFRVHGDLKSIQHPSAPPAA